MHFDWETVDTKGAFRKGILAPNPLKGEFLMRWIVNN
jgi:hypothetical protein